MKYKINIVLSMVLLLSTMLGFGAHSVHVAADANDQLIQDCFDKYSGHGIGTGTDGKLTAALNAEYAKSKCDSDRSNGPCTLNGSSQGGKISCTVPDPSTSSSGCTGGEVTDSKFSNDCVISGTTDPALKACTSSKDSTQEDCGIVSKYVNPLIQVFSAITGLVITAAIIYGGILYSTSGGDAGKVTKAKSLIRNAVLSLVAYVFLYAFLQFLIPGGLFG